MPRQMIHAVKFHDVKCNQPKNFAISWNGLSALLTISVPNSDKTQRELWSPVTYYPDTTRSNRNVEYVTCLVVDMDGEAFDYAKLDGLEYLAYTTWSHTDTDQHWHLVLPLAYPVPGERWSEVWTELHERINVVGDPQTKDPARIFYRPQHKPLATPRLKMQSGKFLEPTVPELFASRRAGRIRNPRAVETGGSRNAHWRPESWWNEPQDLSRFDGMSKAEICEALRVELRELSKSWVFD